MKILVVGGGEVGFFLAGELARENHDVVVIESDGERLARIAKSLDILAIEGDGTSQRLLEQAGIKSADMLVAVTNSDEGNILACMIAREFGVKTKIARVRDHALSETESVLAPSRIGIDLMIHPELETAREILRLIQMPAATEVIEFFDGQAVLLGLRLADGSPMVGKTLIEIGKSYEGTTFRIAAVSRDNQTIIPRGDHRIEKNDLLYVVTHTDSEQEIFKLTHNENVPEIHDLMVLGAGRVGMIVAESLQKDSKTKTKLVDSDPDKALWAAGLLNDTLVVEADGRDIDVIAAEGLTDMDAFVACTGSDETNIVTSLVARHLGVKRIITMVEKKFYLPIIRAIGLEIGVNKHILTSNAILKYIRRGRVLSFSQVRGIDAATVVYQVGEKAKICKKPLFQTSFPQGAVIGATRRRGELVIPTGATQLEPGDEALVFHLPEARNKVDSWFS
ncbi:Trk system potassium transporter TrkA [bacterium]|nr:Trk system potassium transporter TrkA [bacterium]MBU1651099.1 Trk system potassium transporter TrkA [bacterium]MBU1881576.1 Trk system potassium transporter TrkA [bacterium]